MKKVIIIGGGCAGLSAGCDLAEKGYEVHLFEKSRILGGRTSSVIDRQSTEPVDNGQHMFLGCYAQTNAFLRRIGADQHVHYRQGFSTLMVGKNGSRAFLHTYRLPAPLHLLVGYLQYKAFSLRERFSIVRVVLGLKKYSQRELEAMHCREFLQRCRQSPKTQARFWDLLILATLNVAPDQAPASLLKVVLEQGFMSSQQGSASGLADIGLTSLFGDYARRYITQHGGSVRGKKPVTRILIEANKVVGVELAGGKKVYADTVISAVPPNQLQKMIANEPAFVAEEKKLQRLQSSPIVSLHIWTEQKLFEQPYVGFWDTDFHWVFRKDQFMQDQSIAHYTLVASGADHLVRASTVTLIEKAKATLAPLCGPIKITRAKKSLMKQATWLPPLGQSHSRLDVQSRVKGLYFAGDWVNTGLPCTIEGAVVSGHMASRLILQSGD